MKIFAKNKRAKFDYELKDQFEAGISLTGGEVKSVKAGDVDLTGSYVYIDNEGNAQWMNGNIKKYEHQNMNFVHYEETRSRQLLLSKREIKKLLDLIQQKNLTIVPTIIYANKRGKIKLEIYSAKGKKVADKRESIKERDQKRESKNYY